MASRTTEFLFVNRTKDTVSRKTEKAERRAKASHAQRNFRRRARLGSRSVLFAPRTSNLHRRELPRYTRRGDEPFHDPEENVLPTSHSEKLQAIAVARTPENHINAYTASALDFDGGIYAIFQYFLSFSDEKSFKVRPSAKLNGQQNLYFSALKRIIQGCLNNEVHMYALLTMTACGMRNTAGVALGKQKTPEYFVSQAIPPLRAQVAKVAQKGYLDDKQVVLDIFYLFAQEWWQENYEAALTHLRIVKYLVPMLDMSLPLDLYIYESARSDDIIIAVESDTKPMFPLTWEPVDLSEIEIQRIRNRLDEIWTWYAAKSPTVKANSSRYATRRTLALFLVPLKNAERTSPLLLPNRSMGNNLARAVELRFFGAAMSSIIQSLILLVEVFEYTWASTPPELKYAQWVTMKTLAILHRLLSLHLSGEEEFCRIALIILLCNLASNRTWRSGSMNASRLKAALTGQTNHMAATTPSIYGGGKIITMYWKDERMLLWIAVVGASNTTSPVERDWFLRLATRIAQKLRLSTFDELNEVQALYLSLLRTQESAVRELAARLDKNSSLKQQSLRGTSR